MPRLTLVGKALESTPEPQLSTFLSVRTLSSHSISAARATDAKPVTVDAPDDAIIKVEYENGVTEWLRADQFVQEIGEQRGAGESYTVPSALNRGVATRGAGTWVLKALHVLGISPADAIAHETAKGVVEHFEGKMQSGLHRLEADGSFGEHIEKPEQLDNSAPYLLFVHGTASSTKGSFSAFWSNDAVSPQATPEWTQLLTRYKNRILALEHATFSVSPAQNALDAVKLLPEKATIHLITHSRGGLVGELLCLGQLKSEDLSAFEGRDDQKLLSDLGKILENKSLNVSKFVRAACPAAGTILAGKRMDLYLNILLNAIGHIPGLGVSMAYDLFKASALELIKLRADPATLPGIEAMMPESPLIHFLNTKGRSTKADLGVIAGNYEGAGFWGTLKSYALRAYYWEDNDIVVNTRSMMGGMERQSGVWQYFEEGEEVNHFHYFRNISTRREILKWLSSSAPLAEFKRVRGLESPKTRAVRENVPTVWIVPDVFATQLLVAGKPIWLDYDALAAGEFAKLSGVDVEVGKVLDVYQGLAEKLASAYEVKDFPYDWRKPVSDAAAELGKQVTSDGDFPVHFIGHGMGGLVLREFARTKKDVWEELRKKGSKILMLGTPNLGSWQIARMLCGHGQLVRMLALLGRHPESEIVGRLRGFPGLLDLLPDELLDIQMWQSSSLARPEPARLAASRTWQRQLGMPSGGVDGMFYVAGTADATPSGLDEYTPAGDGQVTYQGGAVSGLRTWYDVQHAHGDLPESTEAIVEILARGTAGSLGALPRSTTVRLDSRGLSQREESVFFPSEQDLVKAALGKSAERRKKRESTLRVRITHGHLREAAHPVLVGHYMGDAIVSAEAQLDKQLDRRLSTRFHMETYAGPLGTVEIVRVLKGNPPGALVIGLGEVGELTTEKLRKGALEACLRYAMACSEDSECREVTSDKTEEAKTPASAEPRSAAISALLVGVSGGSFLSVRDSIVAITQAALEANRTLSRRKLLEKVRIDEIEFVELYEDTAIEAAHAIADLPNVLTPDIQLGEKLNAIPNLRQAGGRRFRKPYDSFNAGWWRRIQIENEDRDGASDLGQVLQAISQRVAQAQSSTSGTSTSLSAASAEGRTRLVFTALTDRARLEETVTLSQSKIANSLIADSITRVDYDKDAAVALFELLIPNAFKDQARESGDLVLMLDGVAAQYPWELMTNRMKAEEAPLAVQTGMIRQFKTIHWEKISGPRGAREHNALVIGDTESGLPALPGAQDEAKEVARLLEASGYYATPPLIKQPAGEIIRKLFAADYRIVHLAGHGIFTANEPEHTGMVLGGGMYLSPLEFEQMRMLPELVFVNCCHLGQFERGGRRINADNPGALAASVAQTLIQKGVKAVIAAGWAVDDTAAQTFATTFYQCMLEGRKFGEAVKRARQEAYRKGSTNTWGAYQCYGNPDFALNLRVTSSGAATANFYSRRENIDELRDIAAEAKGSRDQLREELRQRVQRLDKDLPSGWRDGEVLCLLGEAYRELGEYAGAIPIFQESIGKPKANAHIETVEQLANCLDRRAKQLSRNDRPAAQKMWDEAQRLLENLNATLGESSERLSLLGALWKRRGEAEPDPTSDIAKQNFKQSADFYRRAYLHTRKAHNEVDVYSGLNWMAVSYLSRTVPDPERDTAMKECLEQSRKLKETPDFWDRVHEPDALLLSYLFANSLDQHVDEVAAKYKRVFQFAGPGETDSVTGQWKLMQKAAPNQPLNNIINLLDGRKDQG